MTIDGNDMKSDSGFVSESPFILYVANGFVWGGLCTPSGSTVFRTYCYNTLLVHHGSRFYLCFHTTRAKEAILKRVSHM